MKTKMDIFLEIALDLIPEDEMRELLDDFGYENIEPSVAILYEGLEDKGAEFANALGQLAVEAAETPLAEAKFRYAAEIVDKMSGGSKTTLTTEEKQAKLDNAMNWFKEIGGSLKSLIGDATGLINAVNNTDGKTSTNIYLAEKEIARQKEEQTKQYILFGCIGVVVLIIICFMMYAMFRKH